MYLFKIRVKVKIRIKVRVRVEVRIILTLKLEFKKTVEPVGLSYIYHKAYQVGSFQTLSLNLYSLEVQDFESRIFLSI